MQYHTFLVDFFFDLGYRLQYDFYRIAWNQIESYLQYYDFTSSVSGDIIYALKDLLWTKVSPKRMELISSRLPLQTMNCILQTSNSECSTMLSFFAKSNAKVPNSVGQVKAFQQCMVNNVRSHRRLLDLLSDLV